MVECVREGEFWWRYFCVGKVSFVVNLYRSIYITCVPSDRVHEIIEKESARAWKTEEKKAEQKTKIKQKKISTTSAQTAKVAIPAQQL